MPNKLTHIATQTTRDGTQVSYYFDQKEGSFWCEVSGFAVRQPSGYRWIKLKVNTIEDLQANFKGKNIRWTNEAEKLFPELNEGIKMKLNKQEVALVKEYAKSLRSKKLIKESKRSGLIVVGRTSTDDNAIADMVDESDYYAEWNSREGYWLFPEEEGSYDDLEMELEKEFNRRGINARFEGIFESKNTKKKLIKESNTYTMVSALREVADDFILQTELLIDKQYGKLNHEEFKNVWYKNANAFENKFMKLINNILKANK